ncbi:MAG: TolC family protein [Steroidobacteraceae bacterium]
MSAITVNSARYALLFSLSLISACAHYQAKPLDLQSTGKQFSARNLNDPAIQQRLQLLQLVDTASTGRWDRAQLLVVAAENNAKLVRARTQLQVASAAQLTAAALPNPTLSLGSEYNLSQTVESPWLWSISTDWLLDAGLRRQLRIRLADTQLQAVRVDYAEAVWAVRSELRTALLNYLLGTERSKVLSTSIVNQEQLLNLQRQRIAQGEATASEALQVELELTRTRSSLAENSRMQAVALAQLAQALGMPIVALQSQSFTWDELLRVTALDAEQLQQLRNSALLSRADLQRAVIGYQQRELELQQAVRQQYPQFSIGPGYSWDHAVKKISLGLSLGLPVFNHNQGPIAEAEAARNLAGEQALLVQSQILNDIDVAQQAYQTAVSALQGVLQQSDVVDALLKQSQQALALGATDQIGVIAAQLTSNVQTLVVLDAVERMQQSLGQLEDAVRAPLSGPELNINKTALLETTLTK